MTTPEPRDPTPVVGSDTDIARLGRDTPKPAHELTAEEDTDHGARWGFIEQMPEFQALLRAKLRFILPATVFFVVYYFALPYLVGYWPRIMEKKVWGNVNVAYLFALSQFFMAWGLAFIYVAVATGWDRRAAAILVKAGVR
jgi:uncharacterized membrane protein (DUF485 family)